eukprot:jgi/Mesen1/6853/ME000351S05972
MTLKERLAARASEQAQAAAAAAAAKAPRAAPRRAAAVAATRAYQDLASSDDDGNDSFAGAREGSSGGSQRMDSGVTQLGASGLEDIDMEVEEEEEEESAPAPAAPVPARKPAPAAGMHALAELLDLWVHEIVCACARARVLWVAGALARRLWKPHAIVPSGRHPISLFSIITLFLKASPTTLRLDFACYVLSAEEEGWLGWGWLAGWLAGCATSPYVERLQPKQGHSAFESTSLLRVQGSELFFFLGQMQRNRGEEEEEAGARQCCWTTARATPARRSRRTRRSPTRRRSLQPWWQLLPRGRRRQRLPGGSQPWLLAPQPQALPRELQLPLLLLQSQRRLRRAKERESRYASFRAAGYSLMRTDSFLHVVWKLATIITLTAVQVLQF